MGFWNYRIIRTLEDGEERCGIHECYYLDEIPDDGEPFTWSAYPVGVDAEDLEALKAVIRQAFNRPVLDKREPTPPRAVDDTPIT